MSKIAIGRSVIVVALLAGALIAAVIVEGRHQRTRAERLLGALYQMKPGGADFEAARHLATQYGGHSVEPCTKEKCRFDIVISNKIYYGLRLARPKELFASLFIKEDQLESISFGLMCAPSNADQYPLGFGVHISDKSCYPCYEGQAGFMAKPNGTDDAHTQQIIVELSGASTLDQRRAAYELDLDCLSELGDCPRLDNVAPAIWQEIERQRAH